MADADTVNDTLWTVVETDLLLLSPSALVVERSSIYPLQQSLTPNSAGIMCQHRQVPKGNVVRHMFCLYPGPVSQRLVEAPMAAGTVCFFYQSLTVAFEPTKVVTLSVLTVLVICPKLV